MVREGCRAVAPTRGTSAVALVCQCRPPGGERRRTELSLAFTLFHGPVFEQLVKPSSLDVLLGPIHPTHEVDVFELAVRRLVADDSEELPGSELPSPPAHTFSHAGNVML
jgi:hypothetical protein